MDIFALFASYYYFLKQNLYYIFKKDEQIHEGKGELQPTQKDGKSHHQKQKGPQRPPMIKKIKAKIRQPRLHKKTVLNSSSIPRIASKLFASYCILIFKNRDKLVSIPCNARIFNFNKIKFIF